MKKNIATLLLASTPLLVFPSLACDALDPNPGTEKLLMGGQSENPAIAMGQGDEAESVTALGNCDGLPRYVAGTPYSAGQHVFNICNSDGLAYEYVCVIAGWCSLDSALYYEPGNGLAWDDAWDEVGPCDGGGEPGDPVAKANRPYSGRVGNAIAFSSAGSSDRDGPIVAYAWDFGDGATSGEANPVHSYNAPSTYTVTLTVTDNDGNTNTDSTAATVSPPGNPGSLPPRTLIGYWHNFRNQAGYLPIADVSDDWDIVDLAFAENDPFGRPGEMVFSPAEESDASFRAGVASLQARGQKVLISIGGANAHIQLNTIVEEDHRVIKPQLRTMMGFKSFRPARTTIASIELVHMIRKGQLRIANGNEATPAAQFEALVA